MVALPIEMRDLLVEHLDDYFADLADISDTEAIARYVVEGTETVADEVDKKLAKDIVVKLEASGDLEGSLVEVLEDVLASGDYFEYSGEEMVALIEKLCEIDWVTTEDDEAELLGMGHYGDDDD